MNSEHDKGVVSLRSRNSVQESARKLGELLRAKAITLFAIVDHSGEAAKAGMQMRPTLLFIFGNPSAGTPVMLAAPGAALDLPLKLLIWEDSGGDVWISYNSPEYLQERHGFPAALLKNIAGVASLAASAAE